MFIKQVYEIKIKKALKDPLRDAIYFHFYDDLYLTFQTVKAKQVCLFHVII